MPDAAITRAVALIERSADTIRTDQITQAVNLSLRQFDRRFLAAVGLPPKAFARIIRFQALLAAYRAEDFPRWAHLALTCGFYDQSHWRLTSNLSKPSPSPIAYYRDTCDF